MQNNHKTLLIETMLTICVGFIIIFLITKYVWAIIVALLIGLIGLFSEYLSKKIVFLWSKLTFLLSLLIPNILLTFLYFGLLVPISFLSKLFGKKNLLVLQNIDDSIYKIRNKEFNKKSFINPW